MHYIFAIAGLISLVTPLALQNRDGGNLTAYASNGTVVLVCIGVGLLILSRVVQADLHAKQQRT